MAFQEINGDLIKLAREGRFDVIAHSANCWHVMGAGIALQIKKHFMEAYQADLATAKGSYNKLGTISAVEIPRLNRIHVVNIYGQYHPGPHANLAAIQLGLWKLRQYMDANNLKNLGLPLLGCGIGGLDWVDVRTIVQELFDDVTVVHYKGD